MEVGAVKQAFNNEVILLKKKLNQAKIQIIHKLTRKAKTLTEKNVPEKLKVKFTKKAESAVKEVLIIKKMKARDVAKFIVTHKGQLNEYLNRPTVDPEKACARLLLHKALQDKYKLIRERFFNISIQDLLMSRQERRKLKKESREKQKNKKKDKDSNGPVQAAGDWDVENINNKDSKLNPTDSDDLEFLADGSETDDDKHNKYDESVNNVISKPNLLLNNNINNAVSDTSNMKFSESNDEDETDDVSVKSNVKPSVASEKSEDSGEDESAGKFVKLTADPTNDNIITKKNNTFQDLAQLKQNINNKQVGKKHKESNKNKNLKNKIILKKFNKEKTEIMQQNKVVDPFFITATGENYMSIAEPRPPDEVKDVHRQGNRKYRRAVMFGHVPKAKLRRDGFKPDTNNSRFNKFNDNSGRGSSNTNFRSNSFEDHGPQRLEKLIDNSNQTNFDGSKSNNKKNFEDKPKSEKLHPSWEAKKRQSGILPFQGKKIIFDEG